MKNEGCFRRFEPFFAKILESLTLRASNLRIETLLRCYNLQKTDNYRYPFSVFSKEIVKKIMLKYDSEQKPL